VEECDEGSMSYEVNLINNVSESSGDLGHRKILFPTYDLRDIICNGEMAKAFFGEEETNEDTYLIRDVEYGNIQEQDVTLSEEPAFILHTTVIKNLLQQNKQKEAEEYLLQHTIFNPNKK